MRCSCQKCGTYMVHHEHKGTCICPECKNECNICIGKGHKNKIMEKHEFIIPDYIKARYEKD